MKKLSNALLTFAAAAALTTGLGIAQPAPTLAASIPFDFTVGQTKMPAGDYTITSNPMSGVVIVRDVKCKHNAAVMALPGAQGNRDQSYLTFRVHGDRHYLAGAWNSAFRSAWGLTPTAAEREAAIAQGTTTKVLVLAKK